MDAWPLGGGAAVALLAKSTGYLLAAPFLVLALIRCVRTPRRLVAPVLLLFGFVLAVNLGQTVRNENAFGSIIGPADSKAVVNGHFSPSVTATNMLRLFGSGATSGSAGLNAHVLSLVTDGTKAVGVTPADPRILYGSSAFSMQWSVQEDTMSFPLQVVAICLICIAAALRVRPLRGPRAAYVLTSFAAFVIFASYLRWQPWINRLDLPVVLLWPPIIGVAVVAWHRYLAIPAMLCFAWLVPDMIRHNYDRNLGGPRSVLTLPRNNIMFLSTPSIEQGYEQAAKIIRDRHAKTVGLITDVDDWEYPFSS